MDPNMFSKERSWRLIEPVTQANTNVPNIGLAYISAMFKRLSIPHSVADMTTSPYPKNRELSKKADYIGVSIKCNTYQAAVDLLSQPTSSQWVWGGPHISLKNAPGLKEKYPGVEMVSGYLDELLAFPEGPGDDKRYLDKLPFPDYSFFDSYQYMRQAFKTGTLVYPIMTSRGCYAKCLAGDTKVNTVEGMIPIKELEGKKIGVYTYDLNTDQVLIVEAGPVMKTGLAKQLVRVLFDDDTYIDCTPDHKFLTWKNGNQFYPVRQVEKMASELKPKDSVKALRKDVHPSSGRITVSWSRYKHSFEHRLVAEYILGRSLLENEIVHHRDKNASNNQPENLEVLGSVKEHFARHPEIAQRMREDNPQKYYTEESYAKILTKTRGLKRSMESRIRLRDCKLGEKNPNYTDGHTTGRISRIPSENHKVVSVTPIGTGDTYCLEVPGTHWFFANNVLVHNCTFCGSDKGYRGRTAQNCVDEIKQAILQYGISTFQILDDNFIMEKKRAIEFCDLIKPLGLRWMCPNGIRADQFTSEVAQAMKSAGCFHISFGIESSDPIVLRTVKKGETIDDIERAIDIAKSFGFSVNGFFILGLPNSSPESDWASWEWAKKKGIHAHFSILVPIPGTEIAERYPENIDQKLLGRALFFNDRGLPIVAYETKEYTATQRRELYQKIWDEQRRR